MARNKLHPIPHPPRTPVLGNMLTVDGGAPVQDLMRIAREQGPIFWLDMMGTPLVVVSGADLVAELCDEKRFDKAVRGSLRRVRMLGGDALFTAETQELNWQKAHNILLPTFAHRMMQTYHEGMLDIADQLVTKWERLNADEEIDVVRDMTALTLDTIGLCGFNYRFNSFYRSDNHPYVESLVRALEAVMKMRGLPLEDITQRKSRKKLEQDVGFMNGIADRIIKERREIPADDQAKPDLLGFMLAGIDKQSGERLDDVNIRYQMNTFLIAGHETTSGMLSFAVYFLLNNPHVLQKAYEEVDRVLGRDVNAKPTAQQVNRLVYIGQILKESLRLWPTAPAFGLYPYQNETIGNNYKLKKRTFVTVLTAMLHRDKSVWGPQAEVFNPDNFAPEREAKMPPHAYKPFGNGQRACIGRQFAMTEATLVLGMILQRFKLVDHTRYQLKIKESLTIKPEGLVMRVRLRPDVVRGAGMAAAAPKPAPKKAAPRKAAVSHGTKLAVLFGSNMGTAEELARSIAEAGEANGFATTLAALDDHAGSLPAEGAVAIVCASYNGGPPDNAGNFIAHLREAAPGALKGVRYTVFGCGNRDWASTYQAIPRQIDELMAEKGAERIFPRGEGDAREDLDGHFQGWYEPMLPAVAEKLGVKLEADSVQPQEPLYDVLPVDKPPANPIIGGTGALPMRVLANRELQNADSSGRSTRHIEVLLPDGVSYRAGDHLSIVPQNGAALVERAIRRYGFAPGAHILLTAAEGRRAALPVGEAISVHRLLSDFVELQHPATRKQIQAMAQHTRCPFTRPKLEAFLDEDCFRAEVLVKRKSVLDLLEEHPACELPFSTFLEMLPLMTLRYYSISSSPVADGARCSVTVAVVEGPARAGAGVYHGVCSNHLARQAAGGTVQAFVKETKVGFRLPVDPAAPIVMIGPGTGLAPFRGFLRERAALKAQGRVLGPAMLFFGCRHPAQDFIYADELKEHAGAGIVQLHVAFSRHDGKKAYVQDLLKQQAAALWMLIEQGAILYVCGDGGRMEPDVKRTLMAMYRDRTGNDEAAGEAWMAKLAADGRYVLDVWASS
ncbi:MAG: cytochrome P450 [Reyranella sp.]|uniref:bifunctional cytochrome P450/NADPH--P450 reductase n=1 Tax=Reyranella sp. TaxID=1929291 RepID=UPI001218B9FA|nr:cytochrome P450 [Reyranella sp.]TAJ42690.1 MAG: cytochrome P450 [Reyranella sp.]